MLRDEEYDEDIEFVDEDEEDATFPDEDDEDIAEREPTKAESISAGPSFMDDPWPPIAFILIIIGLAITTLTPHDIWSVYVYYISATYLLIVFVAVASVISLGVYRNTETRLRYGGITVLIMDIVSAIFGVADTVTVVATGERLFPQLATPVLAVAFIVVVFSLYTLWLIQRTYAAEATVN